MGTGRRQTRKYRAALDAAPKLLTEGGRIRAMTTLPNEDLYVELEQAGYWWDAGSGEWKQTQSGRAEGKFSGSIFEGFDGLPSGIYRLRIMCHPEEAAKVCAEVCLGLDVVEVSDPYPNRRGPGVRVYITCRRKSK